MIQIKVLLIVSVIMLVALLSVFLVARSVQPEPVYSTLTVEQLNKAIESGAITIDLKTDYPLDNYTDGYRVNQ